MQPPSYFYVLIFQAGQRTLVFSYGSGLAASMFALTGGSSPAQREQLRTIQRALSNVRARLEARTEVSPESFHKVGFSVFCACFRIIEEFFTSPYREFFILHNM